MNSYASKLRLIILLGVILASIISMLASYTNSLTIPDQAETNLSALDLLFDPLGEGILSNSLNITFIFAPLLCIFLLMYNSSEYCELKIIRRSLRTNFWNEITITGLVISLLFVTCLFIMSYIIAGFTTQNWLMNWNQSDGLIYFAYNRIEEPNKNWEIFSGQFNYFSIIFSSFIKYLVGFFSLAIIVNFFKILLKKNTIVFFVFIFFLLLEYFAHILLLTTYITTSMLHWFRPEFHIIHAIFLLIVGIVFYFLGKIKIRTVDFIENNKQGNG